MFSESFCTVLEGTKGRIIRAEADVSDGLPGFSIVGCLSGEVREARERVWIAVRNSGFRMKPRKVTVNLSPADLRKDGTCFDLAVAVSLLSAYGFTARENLKESVFIGELSLDGEVKPVRGVLPMVYTAAEEGFKYCYVPEKNRREASVIKNIRIIPVKSLKDLCNIIENPEQYVMKEQFIPEEESYGNLLDFSDIHGQEAAKRAVEVAVSGMHNILMIGPPGSGKTMIGKRIPGIMPEADMDELMEISKVYSISGLLSDEMPYVRKRPFRSPHHSITRTALTGGGRNPVPGEVSLASGGVLMLDEFPEFSRQTIESLRQPMEDGYVSVSRLGHSCVYPSDFQLVAAMNPCPCGYYPDRKKCRCTPGEISRYLGRISRPVLDRIDICTETVPSGFSEIRGGVKSESSALIRKRVEAVRKIQSRRYRNEKFNFNSQLPPGAVEKYCVLTPEAEKEIRIIFEREELSNRAFHKILKVSRTIADMAESSLIQAVHIDEAAAYRSIDRKYWKEGGASYE